MEKISNLKKICKPSINDKLIGKLFYRRISYYFAYIFILLKISANTVSLISFLLSLFGISLFLLFNDIIFHLFGIVILQISIIFDYSDGEISRYNKYINRIKENNISGKYLDNIIHHIVNPTAVFFFGLRCINDFPEINIIIVVISFFTAISVNGLPILVASNIIVDSIKQSPIILNNSKFIMIITRKINVFLEDITDTFNLKKVLFIIAKLYVGLGVLFFISLDIIIEFTLCYFNYERLASYLNLFVLFLLFTLLLFNLVRTFFRNYVYLNKTF